jgi:hypothetical protein
MWGLILRSITLKKTLGCSWIDSAPGAVVFYFLVWDMESLDEG